MKKVIAFCCALLCVCVSAFAWDYKSEKKEVNNSFQLRAGADFTKKFDHNVNLSISEELRFTVAPFVGATVFNRSFTTIDLSYKPIEYLKIDAGYMLKLIGANSEAKSASHWADPNEYIRHRVFFSVTGIYKYERWQFSLRERALLDMRTDSVNPLEKNAFDWTMRHKLQVTYSSHRYPIKPYCWVELANTLNVPEYQKQYKDNDPTNNQGTQYLERIRVALGTKYKLDSNNAFNFFYRFDWTYTRDINVTKNKGYVELTEKYSPQHAIGFTYEFDW